jgi:glycosyltransferase involved in cell wall biosynthesis
MVITEALARGLPVIAADVGGVREALGRTATGTPAGVLVPPADPSTLAGALGTWLSDEAARTSLRERAREGRETLTGWTETTARIDAVLAAIAGPSERVGNSLRMHR